MKIQHIFIAALATLALTNTAQAQVKIGSNPGAISTNAVLDAEGTSGQHAVMLQNGNFGIGTVAPVTKLHQVGAGHVQDSYGNATNYPFLFFRHAQGTVATPTATQAQDILGSVVYVGHDGTNFSSGNSAVASYAAQNFTTSAQGTNLHFNTTANGSTVANTNMFIDQNGYVGVGTVTPGRLLHLSGTDAHQAVQGTNPANGGYTFTEWVINKGGTPLVGFVGDRNPSTQDFSLGTATANDPVLFVGGGNERMRLLGTNGYFGIGATNPLWALDVTTGSIGFSGQAPVTTANKGVLYWNSVRSGFGEYELVNYHGTGSGGFRFYDFSNTGTPTLGTNNIAFIAPGTGAYSNVSDARVKTEVKGVTSGLQKVMSLRPVSYNMHSSKDFVNGKMTLKADDKAIPSVGFLAQDLLPIVPEAVIVPEHPEKELYTVSYTTLIPVLTKAIQEQQTQIEALTKKNQTLEAQAGEVASLRSELDAIKALIVKGSPAQKTNSVTKR